MEIERPYKRWAVRVKHPGCTYYTEEAVFRSRDLARAFATRFDQTRLQIVDLSSSESEGDDE